MKHKLLFLCALFAGVSFPPLSASASGAGAKSVESATPAAQAMLMLGVRYRLGGTSPHTGFDCSGQVVHVFRQSRGVILPHSAEAQSTAGTPIAHAKLEPGDLVFYNTRNRRYSHVGIYLGDGRFIHAPKPGAQVRIERMSSGYWAKRYDGGRRVMGISWDLRA